MKALNLRLTISGTAITLAIWALPAWSSARGEFDRTLQVNGAVDLQVETGSGSIEVHRGSSNQVHVIGHIVASEWFGGNA